MLNYLSINDIHQLDIASPMILTKTMNHHHAILDNITLYTDIDQAMIWIGERKININSLTIHSKQMIMTDAGCIGLSNHCISLESLNLCSQLITDEGITAIIDNATNLIALNISYCKNISDATLFSLTQCRNLRSVDISACSNIESEACIIHLVQECPSLQELRFGNLPIINDACILAIANNCHNLLLIDIFDNRNVTDAAIQELANGCIHLQTAIFSDCDKIEDSGIEKIALMCPDLITLNLAFNHNITESCILLLAQNCSNLRCIDITDCNNIVDDVSIIFLIAQNPNLHTISVRENPIITDDCIIAIASLGKTLRSLDLCECTTISDVSILAITSMCPNLLSLNVGWSQHSSNSIREIAKCVHLESLSLSYLSLTEDNTDDHTIITDENTITDDNIIVDNTCILAIAQNCVNLRAFNIMGCSYFNDDLLTVLSQSCPDLMSLNICRCDISNVGISSLGLYSSKLEFLDITSCCKITDAGITELKNCHNLQTLLIVNNNNITDRGIVSLASHCRNLQRVDITRCKKITLIGKLDLLRINPKIVLEDDDDELQGGYDEDFDDNIY